MRGLLLLGLGLAAQAAPSDATVVYYNARMAMQEDAPLEAVKLWLLRNALESETGQVSPHDADFASITWAALGELGLCQDGHRKDRDGAGLWPLGMYNHVIRNMGRRGSDRLPRTFDAFSVGRQQREVAIGDALDAPTLATVRLRRGRCLGPHLALLRAGLNPLAKSSDRETGARLLRDLLERARVSLDTDRIRGRSVIEARLFDIDLHLTALARRAASRAARERAQRGRTLGLGRPSTDALLAAAPRTTLKEDSEAAAILRASAHWSVGEWMALEPNRRRFLFDQAREFGADADGLDRVATGVLDALIANTEGEEVQAWISRAAPESARADRIWQGERGAALLALDRDSGFRERAPIALHRGVHDLSRGELQGALRSFAYALAHAPDSAQADVIAALARRWMSHVAGRFELDEELLATMRALVPSRDFSALLEDLLWRAALHADGASFAMGVSTHTGRGALERRLTVLRPLAEGDTSGFLQTVAKGLQQSPTETLQMLEQLVERLEREDVVIRSRHRGLLKELRANLHAMALDMNGAARQRRTGAALRDRIEALLDGIGAPPTDARGRARGVAPAAEVFVGAVRLAPADPLPWPFRRTAALPPSIFTQLTLRPVEWTGTDGRMVFGWRISG